MTDACDRCLRRSHLLAFLSADVERLVPARGSARCGAMEVATETLLDALGPRRRREARAFLERFDPASARRALAGIDAVCLHAGRYPAALRDLAHPPAVLYALGLAYLGDVPAAVVIGTRRPSEYGRTVAARLGRGLGGAGVPVVSGLALGIDAVAHGACLDGGAPTVAVLASGVDVPYPKTNRALYERIRAHGAVVSEMPPGTPPRRWLFPARNRVMAALGRVVVVVEATERSGTLITTDYAAELGREVAAVPGWVTAPGAAGTNALLRDGALLVQEAQDVLDLLFGAGGRSAPAPAAPDLPADEARVLGLVCAGAAVPELVSETGLDPGAVRALLARLELRGLVRRSAAGPYVPAA